MHVKNSRELKKKIKDRRIERNEILVSYDVKNLYRSIRINKALECQVYNGVVEVDV